MNRQEKKFRTYFKMMMWPLLCFLLLNIGVSAWAIDIYSQSDGKDYNTDAPWRVQNELTAISFVFAIADVWLNDLDELHYCKIWLIKDFSDRDKDSLIYSHDFQKKKIDKNAEGSTNGNWEWNVNTFENADDIFLSNGLEITPGRLGYEKGSVIFFQTEITGKDGIDNKKFRKVLKVQVGYPLPKPDGDWYYGDPHYHTEYTNDPYEYGGTLLSTKNAIKAMGLDWVTATDHASNNEDDDFYFGHWDLCVKNWNYNDDPDFKSLKNRAATMNSEGAPLILVGEEITCDAGADPDAGIHLLVYNNNTFIDGHVNIYNNPYFSLRDRLSKVDGDAFAYGAHPFTAEDVIIKGAMIMPWNDDDYSTAIAAPLFCGFQIWNTREEFENDWYFSDMNVNPFDKNGAWPTITTSKWESQLIDGMNKWDELMRSQLSKTPLRKVFIEGGSDAHGDLNYFTCGALSNIDKATDNAVGKVRTLVYAPQGLNPTNIFSSLKNGRSVVTDGPVCIFGIDNNNDGNLNDAGKDTIIGDHVTLSVGKNLELLIKWAATSEFGNFNEIQIWRGSESSTEKVHTITSVTGQSGSAKWSQDMTMKPGTYYYRIVGVVYDNDKKIIHRCLSNPIWVTWANASVSKVPDTGQTKCYDVAGKEITCPSSGQSLYGQDANYTINQMSYTKLDSSGNALPDSAATWSMVKDNVTGLTWEMKTNKDGKTDYNDPHDADNTYTWYDSNPATNGGYAGTPGTGTDTEDFIKTLNNAKYGGFSDWRLPTINELAYIVDSSVPSPGPTINSKFFPNTQQWYWSSTSYKENNILAWYWMFNLGEDSFGHKYHGGYVRAVRGNQTKPEYVDNGDNTITDSCSGLMWQKEPTDKSMSWKDALSYCENLVLGGHSDWRMPSFKELRSIVDYSRYNQTINTVFFPNTKNDWYWTSTSCPHRPDLAWDIHFDYGYDGDAYKTYSGYVRAVRGGQTGLTNGLVASYPFNGNANDVSGNGNHGVNYGATLTTDRFGKPGSSYFFDGVSDYIKIVDNEKIKPTTAITVSVWVKLDSIPDSRAVHIVDRHNSESAQLYQGYLMASPGKAAFNLWTNPNNPFQTELTGNKNIVGDSNFHHLAATYDGSVVRLYVDGVLEKSASASGAIVYKGATDLWLGSNQQPSQYTRRVKGSIDDVLIYNRALSEDEVKQLYTEQPGSILSATPDSRNVASASGTTTFNISNTGTGTMPWTAAVTSGSSWLSITSGSSGSNTGITTCAFTANTSATTRTGTIRITAAGATGSPKDVTVIQETPMNQANQFLGVWSDGVWVWDNATNQWTSMKATSNALQIAAGKVDTDGIDDLIGVWASGLYVRQSASGQWLKLSATLPTWIAAGDLNNDGRDDVIGTWAGDGAYYRNSAAGTWVKLSTPAKQLTSGNIGGVRDDLAAVYNDGLWVRYSADASWKKIDSTIPSWITTGDMTGDKRADLVGSYSSGTYYRNSANGAWTKITTPAEQLASGDIDGDGRDDLVGIWSNAVWVRYGATGQWQKITSSKPRWITTGRMTEAIQAAGSLDDPMASGEAVIDLSKEGPCGIDADTGDSIQN